MKCEGREIMGESIPREKNELAKSKTGERITF